MYFFFFFFFFARSLQQEENGEEKEKKIKRYGVSEEFSKDNSSKKSQQNLTNITEDFFSVVDGTCKNHFQKKKCALDVRKSKARIVNI